MAEDRKIDMEEDLDMIDDMEDLQEGSLFWSLKVPATGTADIQAPSIPEYIVRVTKACFGSNMKKGSRTVVLCNTGEDSDDFVPVCVLSSHSENVNLNLLFNATAEFKVEGTKTSDVWLTGYLQPGNDVDDSPMPFDDRAMLDMSDDMDQDIDALGDDDVAPQLIEEAIRTNNSNNNNNESSSDVSPSPQKKRKLNSTQAQVSANGKLNNPKKRKTPKKKPAAAPKEDTKQKNNNDNSPKKQKNKKSPKQKPVAPAPAAEAAAVTPTEAPVAAATTPEEATTKAPEAGKKNKKKKNKKKKMSGGLEYKDTRPGTGAAIKKGDRVTVYYIGQLGSNQKIFDKTLNGAGFDFVVGGGEVIKGWDMGIVGMKGAGSKRKLWIPAKLAYGGQAQTGIPANSELLFTIEVKKVNA